MKALLLLITLSFSNIAFSATQAEIVDALSDSLSAHDLYCKSSDGKEAYASTSLNLSELIDFDMVISSDTQPVLRFSYKENGEVVALFTTDKNLQVVKKVEISFYTIKQVRKNVGTLINPVFKIIEEKTFDQGVVCQ